MTSIPPTFGLILAGGAARRMGGADKALMAINDVTILDRTLACLSAQCTGMAISTNGEAGPLASVGLPAVADRLPYSAGPLAGILAGLDWMSENAPGIEWMLSVPGDCPFLPDDLAERLHAARRREGKPLACAQSGAQRHPVTALWSLALRDDLRDTLRDAMSNPAMRKVEAWTLRHGVAYAQWDREPIDPFFNINTPDDLAEARRLALLHHGI